MLTGCVLARTARLGCKFVGRAFRAPTTFRILHAVAASSPEESPVALRAPRARCGQSVGAYKRNHRTNVMGIYTRIKARRTAPWAVLRTALRAKTPSFAFKKTWRWGALTCCLDEGPYWAARAELAFGVSTSSALG